MKMQIACECTLFQFCFPKLKDKIKVSSILSSPLHLKLIKTEFHSDFFFLFPILRSWEEKLTNLVRLLVRISRDNFCLFL